MTSAITWVSRTAPGLVRKADGGNTFLPRISDDGSAIVFRSNDPAIDPSVPATLDPAAAQLFVWHASTGEATWVSGPTDGVTITNVDDDPDAFTISGDGSTVVFTSGGTNLVAGFDPPARPGGIVEVYAVTVGQPTVGPISLLSAVDPGGLVANTAAPVMLAGRDAVSDNGTKVIFATRAPPSQFDPAITDGDVASDLLLLDRVAATLTLVNRPGVALVTCPEVFVDPVGSPTAAMSDDGSAVAFSSSCRNIPSGTAHANTDLYRMVPGAAPVLITRTPAGAAIEETANGADPAVIPIAMNGSGSVVAFNAKEYQADGDTSSNPDTSASDCRRSRHRPTGQHRNPPRRRSR